MKNKAGLGRGLGKLLDPTRAPPTDEPKSKQLSPGMASLLRVTAEPESLEEKAPELETESPKPPSEKVPVPLLRQTWLRLTLIAADLLLLGLAARLILRAHGRVGWMEILLCVVAVGMGAWLSCLALWREN